MPIPPRRRRGFLRRRWPLAVLLGLLGAATSLAPAIQAYGDRTHPSAFWVYALATLGFAIAIVWTAWQARAEDVANDHAVNPDDLLGCLYVLDRVLRDAAGLDDGESQRDRLRITVHRAEGDELEQVTPYVGGHGGDPGRRFPIHAGVMGRAARSGTPEGCVYPGTDYEELVRGLVAQWGMTEESARRTRKDRRAWYAAPILEGNVVVGVLYLDSSDPAFFQKPLTDLVQGATRGMAAYLKVRYPSRIQGAAR